MTVKWLKQMLSRSLEFCSSIVKTNHFSVSLGMVNITMTDVSPCAVHLVVSFFESLSSA